MSDPIKLRCSRLPLTMRCAASTVEVAPRIESSDPSAELGTAVHAWLAASIRQDFPAVSWSYPANQDEFDLLTRLAWRAWLSVREWFPEPKCEQFFDYSERGIVLTGHIDVLSMAGSEPRILDWKTGHGDEDHGDQLRGYAALAMSRYPGPVPTRVYAAVLRVREGTIDGRYYTREELAEWWSRLRSHLSDRERFSPGEHCRWCLRGATCEAKTDLLRQAANMVKAVPNWLPDGLMPLLPELRGDIWADTLSRIKLIEGACEVARDLIKADVAAHGGSLPLPGGGALRLVQQERRSIDVAEGWGVLASYLSDPRGCCTTSQAAIRAELAKGQAGPVSAVMRNIMGELEQEGAIRVSVSEVLKVERGNSDGDDSARIGNGSGGKGADGADLPHPVD